MCRLYFVVFAGLAFFSSCHDNPKQNVRAHKPSSKHTSAYNSSVDSLLISYDYLMEAFVQWDTSGINRNAFIVKRKIQSLDTVIATTTDDVFNEKLKSYLASAKKHIDTLFNREDIILKRQQFNLLSKELYAFLEQTRYDNGKVYLQLCPMAFNDVDSGFWLSKSSDIRNPYLGLHHPRYKSGMISCGETKDSINFMQ